MLSTTKIQLPWWLWVIIVLEMLPMFLGPLAALTNPEIMGGRGAEAITHSAYFYANRNLAVGFAFILALWLRNAPMLFALIFIRLLTDLADLPTILAYDLAQSELRAAAIFVFLYYLPAAFALRFLWKHMTDEGDAQPTQQVS